MEGKGCPGSLGRRGEGCTGLLAVERTPRGSAEGLRKAPAHSGCLGLPSPSCVSWLVVACFVKWRVCCLVAFLFPPKVPVWARGFLGRPCLREAGREQCQGALGRGCLPGAALLGQAHLGDCSTQGPSHGSQAGGPPRLPGSACRGPGEGCAHEGIQGPGPQAGTGSQYLLSTYCVPRALRAISWNTRPELLQFHPEFQEELSGSFKVTQMPSGRPGTQTLWDSRAVPLPRTPPASSRGLVLPGPRPAALRLPSGASVLLWPLLLPLRTLRGKRSCLPVGAMRMPPR